MSAPLSAQQNPTARASTAALALRDLRIARLSRELDEIEKSWQKAGRAKFCILGAGQEVAQAVAASFLRPGDWLRGYYRAIAWALAAGVVTPQQTLAQVLGDAEGRNDPCSQGRMMGRHFGSRVLDDLGELRDLTAQVNYASDISPTASQMGPALGLALASKVVAASPEIEARFPGLSKAGREIAHVCIGDASMAEGIALEAINQAVVQKAPLLISVYDNGYGISVPVDRQMAHGSVSKALSGMAGESGFRILGPVGDWDYASLRENYAEAYEHVRSGRGPALVHVLVTQLEGHSSSGDQRRYKSAERLDWEKARDGIQSLETYCLERQLASPQELEALAQMTRDEARQAAEAAWSDYYRPIVDQAQRALALVKLLGVCQAEAQSIEKDCDFKTRDYLTRGRVLSFARSALAAAADGPTREALKKLVIELRADGRERFGNQVFAKPAQAPMVAPEYEARPEEDSGAHVIAAGFATLMSADPRIVVYGEDVGRLGGVTTCTLGLQGGEAQVEPAIWRKSPALIRYLPKNGFGEARVWDTGIAEGTIVGAAAGLALRGLRPVAEIQYHDYVNYGAQQLEDEIACLRHRSAGGQEAPAIIRCHGHRLLGMWHAGSPMAMMLRMPGLRVITPRNAVQAVAMYRAALQHGRDPVFSVEPLLDLYGKVPVPSNLDQICLPLGTSERLREGSDVTIITYGHCCSLALQAASELSERVGVEADVIDLQSLNPLDLNELAAQSIRKTGRVLFLDEDYANGAAAMIAKTLIHDRRDPQGRPNLWHLDAMRILTAPEHKPAYGPDGGFFSKPQAHDIVDAVCEMLDELDGGERRLY